MIVLLLVAVALGACWPTLAALHSHWTDWAQTTYTHGYLVGAICLYLLWRANVGRNDTSPPVRQSIVPLVALAAAALLWVLGVRAGIVSLEWLLLPVIPLLALWAAFGPQVPRRNAFPIGFVVFALPLWGSVNAILQSGTVLAVRGLLRLVGIPSHFYGNFVQIPAGTFEVEGGCSGLHYVIVALALGALLGELRGDGWRGRLKLLALAGALAVVTNWIRVSSIVLAGHYTDMQHYLVTRSHYNYGWALFAVAMIVFFVVERRMQVANAPADRGPTKERDGRAAGRSLPVVMSVLLATAVIQLLSARPADHSLAVRPPAAEWSIVPSLADDWTPIIEGADAQQVETYQHADLTTVQRRQYLFRTQRQGKELGGYDNDIARGYRIVRTETSQLEAVPVTIQEVTDPSGASWLIASTYSAGGRHFATPLPAQVQYAVLSVAKMRSGIATITAWRTPCTPDCQEARKRLGQFIGTMEY
jgi:exosortase A